MKALDFARPNKLCFQEDNSAWKPIPVAHASILIPFNAHSHVSYVSPHKPSSNAVTLQEYAPSRAGFQFLPAAGEWWINLPLAGSTAADVCYIVYDCGSEEAGKVLWDQITASAAANAVDVVKWAGAALAAGVNWNDLASDEQAIAARVRAGVTGRDSSAAANSRNVPIESRASIAGIVASTVNRLLVRAGLDVVDAQSNTVICSALGDENTNGGYLVPLMHEGRRSGYHASRQGRRFTVKSPNITGVAAATALTTTAPTFLLVAGATNELIIRRITVSMPLTGASTTFRALVKTDTADRFSAGGTARAPSTMNNGNVVAATVARNLEAPTATAEGGGTRDIGVKSGQITSGSVIEFDFEDGLIIAAGGSLLLYVVTATAGATIDYAIEFEDANVQ